MTEELDGISGAGSPEELAEGELAEGELASETLARLYEAQGHREAAAAIRQGMVVDEAWSVVVLGESGLDWEGIRVKRTREGILCRWQVGPTRLGLGRAFWDDSDARQALQLVLRIAMPGRLGVRYWDLGPVRESGFCVLAPGSQERHGWVLAAVGLTGPAGRFVPLVHSKVLGLDRGKKSGSSSPARDVVETGSDGQVRAEGTQGQSGEE